MNKIILFVMAFFVAIGVAFAAPKIWDGTADVSWYEASAQAYNITTAEQLAGLAKLVNDGTSDFKGKTITIGADIFLNDTTGWGDGTWGNDAADLKEWTSIGKKEDKPFRGELDGAAGKKNRRIYGLYRYSSLFGYAEGNFRNLDLFVGNGGPALVLQSKGIIDNVHSNIGSIVGVLEGNIRNCSVEVDSIGSFTGRSNKVYGSSDYHGGIAGKADTVSKCHFIGTIKGQENVGGVVGYAKVIQSSYHIGDVVGNSNNIGGLAGLAEYISDSYSKGNVYSMGIDSIGCTYRYPGDGTAVLDKCDTVSIASKSVVMGRFYGSDEAFGLSPKFIGGLVGKAKSIKNSYSEGIVSAQSMIVGGLAGAADTIKYSHHVGGSVSGISYVGGLVGAKGNGFLYDNGLDFYSGTLILNSYAKGDVQGYPSYFKDNVPDEYDDLSYRIRQWFDSTWAGLYIGGLAGVSGIVDSSYHSDGKVSGERNVGGLSGKSGSITRSYSEGEVSGTDSVGGLAGSMGKDGKISMSYAKGVVKGKNFVGGLTGLCLSVESSYHLGGNVSGLNKIGGLAGEATIIKESYSEGNVSGRDYIGGLAGSVMSIDSSYHIKGTVSGSNYVGGLAGMMNNASSLIRIPFLIHNSYSEGNITGSSYVGGLAGQCNKVDSSYYTNGSISGGNYVGGLAGYVDSTINNSHFEGTVTGRKNFIGGLTGKVNAILNSHAEGKVVGIDTIGGLAGYVKDSIVNSYAKGNVAGRNTVGGVSGYVGGSIVAARSVADSVFGVFQVGGLVGIAKSTIDSSYATGNVKGDDNVGGLVGSAYGDISNSYAKGNIVGDEDNSSAGHDNLGGLVGYQYQGSISKSAAYGNIDGTTKLGGLVGRFDGTEIKQSHANGDVTGHYYGDPADEVGNYYIGGLVGYAKGKIDEIYVSSVVKGIEEEPVYTGCIVGYVNGMLDITNSYYDKTKCNLGVDGGEESASVIGAPAKTTAEMQTKSTYIDWNFEDVWDIVKNSTPYLRMEKGIVIEESSSSDSVVSSSSSESASCSSQQEIASSSSTSRNDELSSSSVVSSSSWSGATGSSSSNSLEGKSSSSKEIASSSSTPRNDELNSSTSRNDEVSSNSRSDKSSSSSAAKSSSSSKKKSSSSTKTDAIVASVVPQFSVMVNGRSLQISAARIGATYALFDMQGKVLLQGRVQSANFEIPVACSGNYLIRVGNNVQRIAVK